MPEMLPNRRKRSLLDQVLESVRGQQEFGTPRLPAAPPQPMDERIPSRPPAADPYASDIDSRQQELTSLNTPPTRKQTLLQGVLSAAPIAIGGLFGGSVGASGAAQGVEQFGAERERSREGRRKSLTEEIGSLRGLSERRAERQMTTDTQIQAIDQRAEAALQRTQNETEKQRIMAEANEAKAALSQENLSLKQQMADQQRKVPGVDVPFPDDVMGQKKTLAELQRERIQVPGVDVPFSPDVMGQKKTLAEASRERIPVPGTDIPLSPAVEEQRTRISAAAAANKPASEGERKAAGFESRLSAATALIDEFEPEIAKFDTFDQARLNMAPNVLQSPIGQKYNQAKDDFINAALRRESGAVISPAEYARFNKIYFPQAGDPPDLLLQKAGARKEVLASVGIEAGRAAAPKDGLMVKVQLTNGKTGQIPRSQLQQFLKENAGAKEVK